MAVKDILKQMETQTSEPGVREQMKRRALEDILGVAASQRKTALREAQKRGLGTRGAGLLAGTRVGEAGTEAAARAAKDIELAEQEKQFSRLGQLAQLGMAERGQAFQEEMGREQLGLERGRLGLAEEELGLRERGVGLEAERLGLAERELGQKQQQIDLMRSQLDAQKENDLWNRMETTRRFDQEMDVKTTQMDQAWNMFQQGQINQKEMQQMANDFVKWQQQSQNLFAAEQGEIRRYWESSENDEQRQNALDVATIHGETSKYVADKAKEAAKKPWYSYALAGATAAGGLATGLASLFSDKNLKKKVKIVNNLEEVQEMMDKLNSYSFEYLNNNTEHLGVMAQDLEKSRFGKMMVKNTPIGKAVDVSKLVYGLFAINSLLYNKIKNLEEKVKNNG